jgi:MinD-like ATPase involved in chromosome partitioning or flagellar assembly
MIRQFLSDVHWQDTEYLIIDTPPGTSDEHISVMENLRAFNPDGAILVTTPQVPKREMNFFLLLLYAHTHRRTLGAAGHIIHVLTPANQLMEMGLKIWSLSNPGFESGTFQSLTLCAYQLR